MIVDYCCAVVYWRKHDSFVAVLCFLFCKILLLKVRLSIGTYKSNSDYWADYAKRTEWFSFKCIVDDDMEDLRRILEELRVECRLQRGQRIRKGVGIRLSPLLQQGRRRM